MRVDGTPGDGTPDDVFSLACQNRIEVAEMFPWLLRLEIFFRVRSL